MSTFTEKNTGRITLKENDRILSITRLQVKEIYRWSSFVKEKHPRIREEGEPIIGLFKRSISPMNAKPVDIIITSEEIDKIIWWQELSQVSTELTQEVLTLLKNAKNKVKPEPSDKK